MIVNEKLKEEQRAQWREGKGLRTNRQCMKRRINKETDDDFAATSGTNTLVKIEDLNKEQACSYDYTGQN
jgi:hypothetical protein